MDRTAAAPAPMPTLLPVSTPPVVSLSPETEAVMREIPAALLVVLRKAIGVLARNPYADESQALTDDGTERRVRGSQSLTLLYRVNGEQMHIREVIVVPRMAVIHPVRSRESRPEGGHRPFILITRSDDETD